MTNVKTVMKACLLAVATLSCKQESGAQHASDARAQDARPASTRIPAPEPDAIAGDVDPCSQQPRRESGADLLDLVAESGVLTADRAQRCLATVPAQEGVARRRARMFVLARRLPSANLAAFWDIVRPEERGLVARAVAGRKATDATTLPTSWNLDPQRDLDAATLVARFQQRQTEHDDDAARASAGLGRAELDGQLATAKWLRMVRWTPTPDELAATSPMVVPALVRSLADGPSSANVPWAEWMRTMAMRARLAPRIWGNAWRALRDGVPKPLWAANATQWAMAIDVLPRVRGLEGETRTWFECEDAAALDRWAGRNERTGRCATGSDRWIALVLEAQLLGRLEGADAERARALGNIRRDAQNRAQVITEVANTACGLPRVHAMPLIRALARERDPGVLATLLEGLVGHPELARALEAPARDALIRAPFEAPEGPMLEARVQAIALARMLGREELLRAASESRVRAVHRALAPDGGLLPTPEAPPDLATERPRVRFVTDAGTFEIELTPDTAPRAVDAMRSLVRQRRYDGLRFHRIVPGFVAQGGDPRGDGFGGTETPIVTESSLAPFDRGAVGIALAGLDTGGMQFFVVTADARGLDASYPHIGRVTRGIEVVDGILPRDRILSAEVVP